MTGVLVAAAGQHWEPAALQQIQTSAQLHLERRCVDVPDLVANAASTDAPVALITLDLPGLDVEIIHRLAAQQVRIIAVVEPGSEARASAIGVESTISSAELDELPAFLDTLPSESPVSSTVGSNEQGRVIAVWGPTGAPGRTTVGLTLAREAAAQGASTMLVDADPYGGTVAQMLGILDEVSGLLAAARAANAGRLDSLFDFAYAIDDEFTVLTGLPRAALWPQVRAGSFEIVLATARRELPLTVIDCGFCLESDEDFDSGAPKRNQLTVQALEEADHVIVVGTPDPVGLTRLARGIHELVETVPDASFDVVINQHRPEDGWSSEQIADTLYRLTQVAPAAFIPHHQRAFDQAVMRGQCVTEVAKDSAASRALTSLASSTVERVVRRR